MRDARTDEIAREAARLIGAGRAAGVPEAIRKATESLRLFEVPAPSVALVRRHAQAMAMQALGGEAYAQSIQRVLKIAERVMMILEEDLEGASTLLVGRGAKGQIDAGVDLHVRVYTETDIGAMAEVLVGAGFQEPEFETINTRLGRLNRVRFVEDGVNVTVTRLLEHMKERSPRDLFTGKPLEAVTLSALRGKIGGGP